MNKTPKAIGMFLFAVLCLVVSTGALRAEDLEGKFTLPMEIRWGQATLPPGDYTFRINPQVTPFMAIVSGPAGTYFINAAASGDRKFSGHSALLLARRGRTGFVREMHLAIPGMKATSNGEDVRVYDRGVLVADAEKRGSTQGGVVLTYPLPKGEPAVVAQTPELIQKVPILIASR
jgi:hypothetical protein